MKAKPALITTSALILSSALNFAGVMVWVRMLAPAQFGLFSLVTASALLLNAIGFEWLRNLTARMLYDGTSPFLMHERRSIIVFRIAATVALALVAVALIASLADFSILGMPSSWMPIAALFCLSEMMIGMVNLVSRTRKEYWQFFTATVVRSGLVIVLGVLAVSFLGLGVAGLVVAMAIGQIVAVLTVAVRDPFWRATSRKLATHRVPFHEIRPFLVMGVPLIASSALVYLGSVVDRYLIGVKLGPEAVGFYVAPSDLTAKTIGLLMLAINILFFPAVVRSYEDEGREAAKEKLQDNFALQLLLLSAPVIIIALFPRHVCLILLGSRYVEQSSSILLLVSLAICVRLLTSNFLMLIFQLEKKMNYMMLPPAVSIAILLPSAFVGMNVAGIFGMAVAVLVAQAVTWSVSAYCAKRIFEVRIVTRDVLKVIAAAAAVYLSFATWAHASTTVGFIALSVASLGCYAILLVLMRLHIARQMEQFATSKLRVRRRTEG